ncbi:probable Ufm1-specific protease 2 [Teleopsis dalmanni]|uniref:probable Ufm1-specific protease 2 n=1 Tax=Teleopsis dalmanni TaxID=139649 RepID=UPI000D32C1DC|nr:probable Ufm1-specific protease 2 [Teleopsis dalmanni]XP_037940568.1 probable Ufm1-specific protease 2 [Teleopsis dalmanni]XP_037940574.1 probable Ufm1-specific protease 2 [Teleopsis dalmanni]XP_037940575.1 probable Ufm1-specific protease 2 [Teleopsis dalmanni]
MVMLPKVKVSEFLLKRIQSINQQCSGCLFGVFYGDGTLLLVGFNVESTIGHLNYKQIQHKFPAELDLCGLVKFGDCTDAEAHLSTIIKDVDITDNPILLHCELGTLVGLRASIFMHSKLQDIPYDIMDSEHLYRDFCFTKLKCNLKLYTYQNPQTIPQDMHMLRKFVSGGTMAFQINSGEAYITSTGTNLDNKSIIKDLLSPEKYAGNATNLKPLITKLIPRTLNNIYGALGCQFDIININGLVSKSYDSQINHLNGDNELGSSPAVNIGIKNKVNKICIPLQMESMAMLSKNTKVNRLYDILIESVCRSLRLFEHAIIEHLETENNLVLIPRSYHFFPQELGHFLSCSYLEGISDDEITMQNRRKRLHRHFGLPITQPFFRRANRCQFKNEMELETPLLNVHCGVRPIGLLEGKQYITQGNYYYFHYLQDKGWGCAYRSLQTIFSWFLLQGYTDEKIPNHNKIQKYLVEIGDKPQNFIGSSQWIGSAEVSMCLQGFLNVESKILHVAIGENLAKIAYDLVLHFQTNGTPVMIGGGVLAHTIIGIHYSNEPRDIKFLILDPHYSGTDDVEIIQSKGWCGWKGSDFWNKKNYYNLCLPQLPILY